MFNNYINKNDFTRIINGVRHGYFRIMLSRLTKGKIGRVKDAWKAQKKNEATTWWKIPAISKRYNMLMTGDENTNYFNYIAKKYLADKSGLVGLALGCGNGHRERLWTKLADFDIIEGYDISNNRIKLASEEAVKAGLADRLKYTQGDIAKLDLEEDRYDVIFVEHSLHHFSPLEDILLRIKGWLKPGGLFVVNEYVGPTRFQWTDRQLEIANGVLAMLPEKYRRHVTHGNIVKNTFRPSKLSMILKDPSEAIESERIIPLIRKHYRIIDEKPYYGSILHLIFEGIAGNFISDDPETQRLYKLCLEIEDSLASIGEIESDYTLVICSK